MPSGLNATLAHEVLVAGERLADGLAGVRVPQPHRAVAPPEAIRVPSGLNATLNTESCGRSAAGRRVGRCAASHSRTVLSSLPEAMRVPSGLNATLHTASGGR